MFKIGQRVKIQRWHAGGRVQLHGRGVVAFVSQTKVMLQDGSAWRASDGYAWGSKPTRGIGRSHERRIVVEDV